MERKAQFSERSEKCNALGLLVPFDKYICCTTMEGFACNKLTVPKLHKFFNQSIYLISDCAVYISFVRHICISFIYIGILKDSF